MAILTRDDLAPFADIEPAKADAMIEDAEAMAALAAPCINDAKFADDAALLGALKAVLRSAILRWNDTGSGAVTQIGAGSFQQTIDTRSGVRRSMFWPSEIEQLRDLCAKFNNVQFSGAYSVDLAPARGSIHVPWCSLHFGATYCSCGADIAGTPIYEGGGAV